MALSDRGTKFSLVIEQNIKGDNITLLPLDLESVLKSITIHYFFILHDKDIDDNGEFKRPHYHIVFIYPTRIRVSTIINLLSDLLKIPTISISCETIVNFNYMLRYLIHFDNDDKFQYPPFDVITNNRDMFDLAFLVKGDDLDFHTLFSMIEQGYNRAAIMGVIGLGNYTKYRWAINDLLFDYRPNFNNKEKKSEDF